MGKIENKTDLDKMSPEILIYLIFSLSSKNQSNGNQRFQW